MGSDDALRSLWQQSRERLQAKALLAPAGSTLSLRIPGGGDMWFGAAHEAVPRRIEWAGGASLEPAAALHAQVYGQRADAGALALGGGVFGLRLADFGGTMPGVFDEQVRHLGCMGAAVEDAGALAGALRTGANVALVRGLPLCLGTTAARLALNAELFEKCAKAYVLAVAAGGRVRPLPWLVRHVANGRLMKDERRARRRFAAGLLPEEARGY